MLLACFDSCFDSSLTFPSLCLDSGSLDSDSLDSGSLDSFDAVSVVSPSPEFSLDAVSVFVGSVGSVVSDSGWLEDSVPFW